MCELGKGHVISHCSMCIIILACTCAGMMERSFTINSVIRGYHAYIRRWMVYTYRRSSLRNWELYSDPCAVAVKNASYFQRHLTDIILFWGGAR